MIAMTEGAALAYGVVVSAITLMPKAYVDANAQNIVWDAWTSDLTYGPQRAQVLANLVLLAPLVFFHIVRFRPRRPCLVGIVVAVILPVAIEVAQATIVPGRIAAVEDVIVGAAGGCLAVLPSITFVNAVEHRRASATAHRSGGRSREAEPVYSGSKLCTREE